MTSRCQQLIALEAELLAWTMAKHHAMARTNTRKLNQALAELKRVKTAILAVGPETQERPEC